MNESPSIDIQMLQALEFFHYSSRFQNHLFFLALDSGVDLQELITDLRVLHAAKIKMVVICHDMEDLNGTINLLNARGFPFEYFSWNAKDNLSEMLIDGVKSAVQEDCIPVLGLNDNSTDLPFSQILDQFTFKLATSFTVDKVFFLSEIPGLIIDGEFISHLTTLEASKQQKMSRHVNIGEKRLSYFVQYNIENGFEIVLLEGKTGCLFEEIFTHRGKGTLLTNDYPNVIRKGVISDVMEISLLMKPYMQTGIILPVTEDEISKEVDAFFVYSVNNSIVAIAKLTDHGPAVELAKFCTLPRYQGKGRARELAEKMIQNVRDAGKEYIFALSVEPKMFVFFKSLGFYECDRNQLPESWLRNYDVSRPSKAFRLDNI